MKTQIIEGLTQGAYESYLNKRQYEELYWPTFFPIKNVNTLDSKTLIGEEGSRVAAAIISYNAKAPEATRKSMSTKHFDIPKIAFKRVKTENEILEHQVTKAIIGNDAVIEDYFNDAKFVVDACNARMEWLVLTAMSTTKVQLTTSNNPAGIVNETVIDFGVPTANKKGVAVAWSTENAATMTPIADFKTVVKAARAKGISLQYALMNPDAYDLITGCIEFQTAAKSLLVGESQLLGLMSIEVSNKILKALRLPEIRLIDTSIEIESKAGVRTASNPWNASYVLFVPEVQQGRMHNAPIAEEIEKPLDVIQAKRGNVLVSVKKEFDPVSVVTKGECNAFPSWPLVDKCFSMYVAGTSWA